MLKYNNKVKDLLKNSQEDEKNAEKIKKTYRTRSHFTDIKWLHNGTAKNI